MKLVLFKLSMPNRASWNGGWSGSEKFYGRIRRMTDKAANNIASEDGENYYYNFGDGWGANVEARIIDGVESRRLRKTMDDGFCGYGWMITSIICHKEIRV